MEQPNQDRVRENTPDKQNQEIDQDIRQNLQQYVNKEYRGVNERLNELDKEWDIERALELNASVLALGGLVLGILVNKRWFALPMLVTSFLAQHAIQGWCPPLPILRKLGFRTRAEIDKEKFALKALRGDFRRAVNNPEKAWRSVKD